MTKKIKILIWLYLILIHVFLSIVLVKTDAISRVYEKLGINVAKNELSRHYHIMVGFHNRINKNMNAGSVVFIGDSITQGLAVSEVSDKSVNFGIGGDTTLGVITRLGEYTALDKSQLIVLAIGINDLKYRNNQEIILNFINIFERLPADIPILVSAILPVDEISSEKNNYNKRINAINTELKKISIENSRLYFMDISKNIIDSTGNLEDKYHNGDGVHISRLGYQVWIEYLKESILKINTK